MAEGSESLQGSGLSIMEEMFEYFTAEIESMERFMEEDHFYFPGSQHKSVIKFHGRSILPPLMTPQRYAEAAVYRHQAVQVEAEQRSRARHTLLQRIHNVMSEIEEKYSGLPQLPPVLLDSREQVGHNSAEATQPKIQMTSECKADRISNPVINKEMNDLQNEDLQEKMFPRSATKDSGVYVSKEQITHSSVTEPYISENNLDTMADITDISDEENTSSTCSNDDKASMVQCTLTCPTGPAVPPLWEKGKALIEGNINNEYRHQNGLANDANDPEHESQNECLEKDHTNEPGMHVPQTDSTTALGFEGKQHEELYHASLNALGSGAQSGMSAFRQPVTVIASVRSTSSSGTTFSSEEMSRTVIGREEAELCVAAARVLDDTTSTTTDADTIEDLQEEKPNICHNEVNMHGEPSLHSPQLVELDFVPCDGVVTVGSQTEHLQDIPRCSYQSETPLLSKTDLFDTPDLTSESEQDLQGGGTSESETEARLKRRESHGSSGICSTDVTENCVISSDEIPLKYPSHCKENIETNVETSPSSKRESSSLPSSIPASPGPMSTPNVSAIENDDVLDPMLTVIPQSRSQVIQSKPQESVLSDPFVTSLDTSQLYTASTELGPYMATSTETFPSSMATLPNMAETVKVKNAEPNPSGEGSNSYVMNRVRKDSYTLEHPSPALLQADAKNKNKVSSGEAEQHKDDMQLTSSMEDLQLKPVQRKLEYADGSQSCPQPMVSMLKPSAMDKEAEKQGKQQHLQKYLSDLSQMPVYQKSSNLTSTTKQGLDIYPNTFAKDRPIIKEAWKSTENISGHHVGQAANEMNSAQIGGPDAVSLSSSSPAAVRPVSDLAMTQEELLQMQSQYFESLQKQLMQQQQTQLQIMLAEQQQQQMMLQQELMQMANSIDSRTMSETSPHSNTSHSKKHSTGRSDVQNKYEHNYASYADPMDHRESNKHERPFSAPDPYIQHSMCSDALVPSQGMHNGSITQRSPAGVYCQQGFPAVSPMDGHKLDPVTATSDSHENSYNSPAVLRYKTSLSQPHSTGTVKSDTLQQPDLSKYVGLPSVPSGYSQDDSGVANNSHLFTTDQLTRPHTAPAQRTKHVSFDTKPQDQGPSSNDLHHKFCRVSAAVKGYLTRRLMRTERVQRVIQTIKDTAVLAINFQQETPIKKGHYSNQDRSLQSRILNQLVAAMYEIHEVFFESSTKERMQIIQQSRVKEQERLFKQQSFIQNQKPIKVSAATQKAMERRKKAQLAEAKVLGSVRSKSAPPPSSPRSSRSTDLRAIRPKHAAHSPIKPDKENLNRVAAQDKSHMVVKRIQSTKTRGITNQGKVGKKTTPNPVTRKVARPGASKSTKSPVSQQTETSPPQH